MASNLMKKLPRVKPKTYTTCVLYNTDEARVKLRGINLAACNPKYDRKQLDGSDTDSKKVEDVAAMAPVDLSQLTVSDKMSCNYCDVTFEIRLEQKRHYRSDWHRYNLKLRIRGKVGISEDQFETISGNISSLSGSDTDEDATSDVEAGNESGLTTRRLVNPSFKLDPSIYSSTDSESETAYQVEEAARRLPKVYFRNEAGELVSVYRCVINHKKNPPNTTEDLIAMTTQLPNEMNWAIIMAGGGHFAAAVFSKEKLLVHKTFHRYVVRAKRGTAQSSRDSQGNAPKSGGASLRRYNENALTEEIQELINSWKEHIQICDRIFLRAPSFNRKIFFGSKSPPFQKDDQRIRLIPFQTRRPTFNEVRRVYEILASIECYGEETDLHEFIPISPPQVFNRETGQLETRDENTLSPKHRKILNKKLRNSPLSSERNSTSNDKTDTGDRKTGFKAPLPDHVLEEETQSSGTSTCSETELVEMMQTISTLDLKEFGGTRKPKRRKKIGRKRSGLQKCQKEPESNIMEEEKYHLKNNLYTACKVGDLVSLKSLLAVFILDVNTFKKSSTKDDKTHPMSGSEQGKEIILHSEMADDKTQLPQTELTDDNIQVPVKQTSDCIGVQEGVNQVSGDLKVDMTENVLSGDIKIDMTEPYKSIDILGNSTKTDIPSNIVVTQQAYTGRTRENMAHMPDLESTSGTSKASVYSSDTCSVVEKDKSTVGSGESLIESISSVNDDVTDNIKNQPISLDIKESDKTPNSVDLDKLVTAQAKDFTTSSTVPDKLNLSYKQQKENVLAVIPGSALPDLSPVVTAAILNETFGDSALTLLHVAAKEGHKEIVYLLMESGASPSIKDKGGQTPYMTSKDKSVRNEFRKFMGNWPEKYDYEVAQIPPPLSEEQEAEKKKKESERKRARQKEKKERTRVQREEEFKKKTIEKEKNRYLNLSDREKRALAAEKRLVKQVTSEGGDKPVLSRCFQCGEDMTEKVPFEYSDFKFCSPKCLQLHRKAKNVKS